MKTLITILFIFSAAFMTACQNDSNSANPSTNGEDWVGTSDSSSFTNAQGNSSSCDSGETQVQFQNKEEFVAFKASLNCESTVNAQNISTGTPGFLQGPMLFQKKKINETESVLMYTLTEEDVDDTSEIKTIEAGTIFESNDLIVFSFSNDHFNYSIKFQVQHNKGTLTFDTSNKGVQGWSINSELSPK